MKNDTINRLRDAPGRIQPQAVQMSVYVVRAFVRLRQILASNTDLARKLDTLEKTHDTQFKSVFAAIRQLMALVEKRSGHVGMPEAHPKPSPITRRPKSTNGCLKLHGLAASGILFPSDRIVCNRPSRNKLGVTSDFPEFTTHIQVYLSGLLLSRII
jgi:hypothetical protein